MPTPQDFNDFEPSAPAESGDADAGTPPRGVAHTAAATPAGSDVPASSSSAIERDGASLSPSPRPTPKADPVAFQRLELPPIPAAYQELLDAMERGRREIQGVTGLDQIPENRTASSVLAALRTTGAQERALERARRSIGMIPEARRGAAALAHDPAAHWEPWPAERRPSRLRRLTAHLRDFIRDVVADDAGARAPGRS